MPDERLVQNPKIAELEAKISEFRDNNKGLSKKISELETRLAAFGDIAPEAAKAALATVQQLGDITPDAAKAALARVQELEAAQASAGADAQRAVELAAKLEATELRLGVGATIRALFMRPESEEFLVGKVRAAGYVVKDGQITHPNGIPVEDFLRDPQFAWCALPSKGGGAHTSSTTGSGPSKPVIDRHDPAQFGQHLEGIAKGDVTVI